MGQLDADLLFEPVNFVRSESHGGQHILGQGTVDEEIIAGRQRSGGDQGHERHKAFHQHGAIADKANVFFRAQHLGRGAG